MFDAHIKAVGAYVKDLNPSEDEILRFYAYIQVAGIGLEFMSEEEGIAFLQYSIEKEESEKVKQMMIYVVQGFYDSQNPSAQTKQ
jgi:hypothetical protein